RIAAGTGQHFETPGADHLRLLTVGFDKLAHWHPVPADRLVGAVFTRNIAQPAVDALALIDLGDDLVIQVQLTPGLDARHGLADQLTAFGNPLPQHPAFQPTNQLLDDAEAVVHDRRTDLHAAGSQQHELDRVLPGLDAADAADRHPDVWIAGNGRDQVEGDR